MNVISPVVILQLSMHCSVFELCPFIYRCGAMSLGATFWSHLASKKGVHFPSPKDIIRGEEKLLINRIMMLEQVFSVPFSAIPFMSHPP
jgi:hypothetical protein